MTYKPDPDSELSLWNEEEGFYFDAIQWGNYSQQLPIRSLVGLIPLYATLTLEAGTINRFPGFKKRMEWFMDNRSEMSKRNMANMKVSGKGDRRLLALTDKDRLVRILERMLDEDEFFSDFGIRSCVLSLALFFQLLVLNSIQVITLPQGPSVLDECQRTELRSCILARRLSLWHVWWQLQLAWTNLVGNQLPPYRVSSAFPPVLWG
jgi:hypothetical protein